LLAVVGVVILAGIIAVGFAVYKYLGYRVEGGQALP